MSWSFLLTYGLSGILGLFLQDQKSIEEMELYNTGAAMMQQQSQAKPADYTRMFKGEKDFYELIKYEQVLEDVEDAFLFKF